MKKNISCILIIIFSTCGLLSCGLGPCVWRLTRSNERAYLYVDKNVQIKESKKSTSCHGEECWLIIGSGYKEFFVRYRSVDQYIDKVTKWQPMSYNFKQGRYYRLELKEIYTGGYYQKPGLHFDLKETTKPDNIDFDNPRN